MWDLLFLGTCACDYSPKLKDEFANCFDYNARRSSSALLCGKYLIDCGDHCLDSLRIANVKLAEITDIFVTHLHSDHFRVDTVETIAAAKAEPLRVWVSEEAVLPAMENVTVMPMKKLGTLTVEGDLTVTGLPANHDPQTHPQFLLFEKEEKSFLYATDGAWFMLEAYYFLRDKQLDLVVFDATCGDYEGDYRMAEHNSIPMIRLMLPSLKTWGAIGDHTQMYLTHLAPSLHKPHAETVELVKADGLNVSYDGLRITV